MKRRTTTMTFGSEDLNLLERLVEYGILAGEPLGDEHDDEDELETNLKRATRLSRRLARAIERVDGPDPEELELRYGNADGDHPELEEPGPAW